MIKDFLINSTKNNDIILDFFAGSGTTAHAVMALNAEDQGNRKFITVQIDEKTDKKSEAYKAGYESIFDITKARIEKASEKLNDKSGFKIYETTPIFEGYLDDLEELSDNTTLFNGSELTNDELETLLTTWKVHDGMRLHESLEALNLGSYVAYTSENTIYFMDKGFNLESLQAFVEKLDNDEAFEPSKLVLFGYNFDSKHQREFKEALANYSNKKSIELDMVVRY
jgi:adenine-specific DNA-methyltransferase